VGCCPKEDRTRHISGSQEVKQTVEENRKSRGKKVAKLEENEKTFGYMEHARHRSIYKKKKKNYKHACARTYTHTHTHTHTHTFIFI